MTQTTRPRGEVVLFEADDGRSRLEVELRDETVWLSLNQMAELFERDKSVISRHLRNVFQDGELTRDSVVAKHATTAADGKTYRVYLVTKNHAFVDGNKRIAAAIFLTFLAGSGVLYRADGSKRLADNALVALTLLIAESAPAEKDTIVKVVVNLINRANG